MTYADQCSAAYDSLQAFFNNLSEYIGTTGIPIPTTPLESLDFADLQTLASNGANDQATFSKSVATDVVAEVFGIQREISMARKSKFELINSATSEFSDEAEFRGQQSTYQLGVLNGTPTSGSAS